jgi:glutamyl/glutaminyl-tRNA synthetase
LEQLSSIIIERITHFGQIKEMVSAGELTYFFDIPTYEKEKLFWKDERDSTKLVQRLEHVSTLLGAVNAGEFTKENVKSALWGYAEEEGRGAVLWPMRYALSGRDKSPDPFQLAEIFGKEETLKRLRAAITHHTE